MYQNGRLLIPGMDRAINDEYKFPVGLSCFILYIKRGKHISLHLKRPTLLKGKILQNLALNDNSLQLIG